ncbi:MAG: hypothetical protein EXQ91_07450 [Alphaproteobacteria bacterium]|nr:hypothetical protein [Alphaproteobacteria bacterium]
MPSRPLNLKVRRLWRAALIVAALVGASDSASVAGDLNLPRFVSLRADKVNVRAGPGVQYPIVWVFVRRGLPIEVIAEYDLWRKIRDRDGIEGWAHRSLLTGSRAVIVTGNADSHVLYRTPDANSTPVALVESGVIAKLLSCEPDWCRVKAGNYRGWIERTYLWGVYPSERSID